MGVRFGLATSAVRNNQEQAKTGRPVPFFPDSALARSPEHTTEEMSSVSESHVMHHRPIAASRCGGSVR